jgi:hypothetical protein
MIRMLRPCPCSHIIGLLLRLFGQLRRECVQPTYPGIKSPQSSGIIGGNCHKMLSSQTEGGEERALEREKADLSLP